MAGPRRVWCNVGGGVRLSGVLDLMERLVSEAGDLAVVLSASRGVTLPDALPHGIAAAPAGADARKILREIEPSALVVTGDDPMLAAIQAASEKGLPRLFIDARVPQSSGLQRLWLDFRMRGRLRLFDRIFAASERDAAQFRQMVGGQIRVDVIGPLERGPSPLPFDNREYDAIAQLVAARPVWCASGISTGEYEIVEAAHRRASRTSHRLLLIAVPQTPNEGARLAAHFAAENWLVARREEGEYPDQDTQVYVADTEDELGLWYRLAPITFLGSSLDPDGTGLSPFSAAFLGSAVIHGPNMSAFADEVQQMQAGRASTLVTNAEELGKRVVEFLSPDRAAQQAHRAWEVTSASAETTTRALEAILDALDRSPV